MDSRWLQWILLNGLTGNPVLSAALLLGLGWVLDHFTLGLLPNPVRALARWQRADRLRRTIAVNPHDRRSRFELADLLVDQRRFASALEVLKPNVAAGDDDAGTLYLMGVAAFGAGHPAQGEVFLGEARQAEPGLRAGAIDLELGRGLLQAGQPARAREALERYLAHHPGTVEGRVLLAQALDAGGGPGSQLRDEAWAAFVSAPTFQRRRERWWAWRARPQRPLAYLAALVAAGALLAQALPARAPISRGPAVLRPGAPPAGDLPGELSPE